MEVKTLPLSLGPVPGAQRPAQRGVHTAQHTTAARKPTACKYFSAFRRMRLTHSAVVHKVYVKKCREARGIEILVACFLLSSAQMRLCQTPGRRRPLITGRFWEHCCPWSRVGRYTDTCRGCVCCLAAVCWLVPTY